MNKKKVILGSCGVLICLVGGGFFAVNQFVDRKMILNQLYNNIEKQTGRKLALQNLDIHFFPWPEIQASKITLSNMPNGKNPNFITAEHLKANLNLWSLWQRKIHFKSIALSDVHIYLERNEQGQKNWDLQSIETIKNNDQPQKSRPAHHKWGWQFNNIKLENVECWYNDALNHTNTHLLFKQAELNQLETNKVKFHINGLHHHANFTISGKVSNFNDFLESDNIVITHPAKFQINLTEYIRKQNVGNLRISGTLKSIVKAKGYDITLRGTILNLDNLNQLFPHANLPSIENITLNTAIKDIASNDNPQGQPQIGLLQLHTGKINLTAFPKGFQLVSTEIIANDLNAVVNTQIVGQLHGTMFRWSGNIGQLRTIQDNFLFNVDAAIPVSGKLLSANYNIQLDGTIGGKDPSLATKLSLLNYNKYFKDFGILNAQNILYMGNIVISFPFTSAYFKKINKESLENITVNGKISSNSLDINQYHFDNFSSNILWKNKELTLKQLQLFNKQSDIKADIFYSVKQNTPELNMKIISSSFPMNWIEDYFSIANIYTGQIATLGNLSTKGNNWQEWQHNLSGKLGLFGIDGKLEAEGLKHYIGKASATLPLKKSLSAQCIAIRTQINPNKLYFDTITLQTNQFALNGQGNIDLLNQNLNLHFIPDVWLGAISASAPIRIGGTLSKPYTTFDMNKNKVFSLNINALNKSLPITNYCNNALEKARNPLGIVRNKE